MSTEKDKQRWRKKSIEIYRDIKRDPIRMQKKREQGLKSYYKHRDEILKRNRSKQHIRCLQSHGLTEKEYQTYLTNQNNACAICKGKITENFIAKLPLCIDHDHVTGKIRGLLCNRCNAFIGLAKDSIIILKDAIKYLEDTYEV
jgi:hypothetical protein